MVIVGAPPGLSLPATQTSQPVAATPPAAQSVLRLACGQALARAPLPPGPVSAEQVAAVAVAPGAAAAGVCTTIVLRNVPDDMFTALLVNELWRNGIEADFAIVCVDPSNHTNTGYAYVNVCDGNNARKLLTWHGRDMLAGRLCTQGGARRQLSVAYAAKQGFDMCVTLNGRRQLHDPRLRAWVLPARATRRREIEASMHEARTRAFATTPARTVVAAELLVRLQPAGPVAAVPVASGDQFAPNLRGLRSEV
jgi:hypothetical protein